MSPRLRKSAGFTLLEMLLTVVVIAILVGILVLDPKVSSDARLKLAAERVAEALRFAHTEAIRTESYFRLTASTSGQITVHALDQSKKPPKLGELARHPVTRQPMDFNLIDETLTQGVAPTTVDFDYEVVGSQNVVDFGPTGMPKFIDAGGAHRALTAGSVVLTFAGRQRVVSIEAQTGRVTIQ
ncbi:MAG: GspH/FimT family pseudopilin [Gammaproteobacteria bacterium]|jgi:prepilin-type N-terminal cleavage/methylation domain-containing protein